MSVKPKILVIDDEDSVHIALNTELGEKYSITSARNKEEAEQYLKIKPNFNLAIVDLVLYPEMYDDGGDGFDLVSELNELNIPVIIFTNRYHPRDFRKGLGKGASNFITKKEYADNPLILTNAILDVLNPK